MNRDESVSNYLIECRKKAGLSQQEAANRASIIDTQKMVSRIEKSPLDFSLQVLLDYMTAIGAKPEELLKRLDVPKFHIERTIHMLEAELQRETLALQEGISNGINALRALPESVRPEAYIERMIAAENELSSVFGQAIMALFGPSDSGKSFLMNFLMGHKIAPEGFQPMTAASTLFVHADRKPSSVKDNVIVFKYKHDDVTFKLDMLADDCFENFVIATGDYSILEEYGARDENDDILYPEAYLAVVYVNAPILEKVALLDTPGQLIDPDYASAERGKLDSLDVKKAYEAMALADGFVFTSSINKFLRDDEPEFFSNILRAPGNIPLDPQNPLKNITIVATQAFAIKSVEDFKTKTSRRAAISFNKAMTHLLYEDWSSQCEGIKVPAVEDWDNCMLPFWDGTEEFVNTFTQRFDELVDDTVNTLSQRRLNRVNVIKRQLAAYADIELSNIDKKRMSNNARYEEVKAQDARFRREIVDVLEKFKHHKASIKNYKSETLNQLRDVFENMKSEDFMVNFIAERFEDKDDAKKRISEDIGQYLETRTKTIVNNTSKRFAAEVELLVNEFSSLVPGNDVCVDDAELAGFKKNNLTVSSFDAQSAFIGGMSGMTAFGAMGAYVATISSNLGAYILVGKAAGILTSLGITGSVTTLPWLVSLTGGPVVWGTLLAGALGYLVFRLFSDWKKSMAKSICKEMRKGTIFNDIESEISKYWDVTAEAFDKALDSLCSEADEHIRNMFREAETVYDNNELNSAMDTLSTVKATLN